ncbi:MAG: hypothetical protein AAGD01_10425 [Acidobacteriota bacterium]
MDGNNSRVVFYWSLVGLLFTVLGFLFSVMAEFDLWVFKGDEAQGSEKAGLSIRYKLKDLLDVEGWGPRVPVALSVEGVEVRSIRSLSYLIENTSGRDISAESFSESLKASVNEPWALIHLSLGEKFPGDLNPRWYRSSLDKSFLAPLLLNDGDKFAGHFLVYCLEEECGEVKPGWSSRIASVNLYKTPVSAHLPLDLSDSSLNGAVSVWGFELDVSGFYRTILFCVLMILCCWFGLKRCSPWSLTWGSSLVAALVSLCVLFLCMNIAQSVDYIVVGGLTKERLVRLALPSATLGFMFSVLAARYSDPFNFGRYLSKGVRISKRSS